MKAQPGPVLAISPHLDDAIMGVGATLAALSQSGQPAIVCTVFAGEPPETISAVAQAFHADCGLADDAVARRKAEDLQAAATIGAHTIHLPFLDAIYRRHGGDWLCQTPRAMFGAGLPDESQLVKDISESIAWHIEDLKPSAIWTCAAIGGHIDHQLTRLAVGEASRQCGYAPLLWEGVPYAFGSQPPAAPQFAVPAAVEASHIDLKIAAIAKYPSQLRMLFSDTEDWREAFLNHARQRQPLGSPELLWPFPL